MMELLEAESSANLLKSEKTEALTSADSLIIDLRKPLFSIFAETEGGKVKTKQFGARLALLREREHLSIAQLANVARIDYMQIHRYESGKTQPTLDSAARLAAALKVTLDELATGNGPAEPPTFRSERLLEKMRELDQLPPDRQELALRVLDTVISGYELETLSAKLSRK